MLGELITSLRASHVAIAAALVRDGDRSVEVDAGADPVDADTLFEVGSITKTMTGTLLAVLAGDGVVSLDTPVGELLDGAGAVAGTTLRALATHTAGLPRLAPNHDRSRFDPKDPYAAYDAGALLEGLAETQLHESGRAEYSNFGFQLLGHVLGVAAGRPYDELVVDRVLTPAGCAQPRCGHFEPDDRRIPGYAGGQQTPRWRQPLAGAGGVELGIDDLSRWLEANLHPERTALAEAVALAQQVHWGDPINGRGLGWQHYNGGVIHNGGTGGFHSFCGFVPGLAGVAVLTNLGGWDVVDTAAIRFLTKVITDPSR
jgi:serine-type D-Ala-D-Ala carboxypeptidase/endopeptidase